MRKARVSHSHVEIPYKTKAVRKKRMRLAKASNQQKNDLKTALEAVSSLEVVILENSQNQMQMCKNMARLGRWRWELRERKESLMFYQQSSTADKVLDPSILNDVSDIGSYGIVKMQLYRGIYVAVKQFLPCTFVNDVINEVKILLQLSHPNVLCCFGICTNAAAQLDLDKISS